MAKNKFECKPLEILEMFSYNEHCRTNLPMVVGADDGLMPQTRERIMLAQLLGLPYNVFFLKNVDLMDVPELIGWELGELLSEYDFPIFELMYAPDARSTTGRKKKSGASSPRPTWNMRRPGRGSGLKYKRSIIKLTSIMSM